MAFLKSDLPRQLVSQSRYLRERRIAKRLCPFCASNEVIIARTNEAMLNPLQRPRRHMSCQSCTRAWLEVLDVVRYEIESSHPQGQQHLAV